MVYNYWTILERWLRRMAYRPPLSPGTSSTTSTASPRNYWLLCTPALKNGTMQALPSSSFLVTTTSPTQTRPDGVSCVSSLELLR